MHKQQKYKGNMENVYIKGLSCAQTHELWDKTHFTISFYNIVKLSAKAHTRYETNGHFSYISLWLSH